MNTTIQPPCVHDAPRGTMDAEHFQNGYQQSPIDTITVFWPNGNVNARKTITAAGKPDRPYSSDRAVGRFLRFPVKDTNDLYNLIHVLQTHRDKYVVHGVPVNPDQTPNQRRAYRTNSKNQEGGLGPDYLRRVFCFDIDGVRTPEGLDDTSEDAIRYVLQGLGAGFSEASIVYQFSNSAGTPDKAGLIKAHIWFISTRALSWREIDSWARQINDANVLPLTKGSLVDLATLRPTQANYTASPKLERGVSDPFAGRSRVGIITGQNAFVEPPADFSAEPVAAPAGQPAIPPRTAKVVTARPGGDAQPIVRDPDTGLVIDGRERWLRDIRWHISKYHILEDTTEATKLVWQEFSTTADLTDNKWTYAVVEYRTKNDAEILKAIATSTEHVPNPPDIPAKQARARLDKHIREALTQGGRIAIKAAAGLGKSSAIARHLPHVRYVEVYVPTSEEVDATVQRYQREGYADVRGIHGRSPRNCSEDMIDDVRLAGEVGYSVERTICERCEYYKKCAYYRQDPDTLPAIRVMPHAMLAQPRDKSLPEPDILIIDETLIPMVVQNDKISKNDLLNYEPNIHKLGLHWNAHATLAVEAHPDFMALADFLQRAYRNITQGKPIHEDTSLADLRMAYNGLQTFKESNIVAKDASIEDVRELLHKSVLRTHQRLQRMLEYLIEDLERFGEPRRLEFTAEDDDALVQLWGRRELPKLDHIQNILLLDADLEEDIVNRYGVGEFQVIDIPARRNCRVIAVKDSNFSKRGTYDYKNKMLKPVGARAMDFIRRRSDAVITYKILREAVADAPRSKRLSFMSDGTKIGHFGFLRGMNDLEGVSSLAIFGRHNSGDAVVKNARALFWDDPEPVSDDVTEVFYVREARHGEGCSRRGRKWVDQRVRLVENATDHAETRQAIDRGRWIGRSGTLWLLTAAPIPGVRIDRFVAWTDIENADLIGRMLDYHDGAIALRPSLLVREGWFSSEQQAKDWLRNEWEDSIKDILIEFSHSFTTGKLRVAGQRGRNATRYIGRKAGNVWKRLERFTGKALKFMQPERTTMPWVEPPDADPHPDAPKTVEEARQKLEAVFGADNVNIE